MAVEDKPLFHRWGVGISLLALVVSGASFWMSFRAERLSSAPNVQLLQAEGQRSHEIDADTDNEDIAISFSVTLKNYGRAPVQIINVRWEPITLGEPVEASQAWLAISEAVDPYPDVHHDFFYQYRSNPVLAIRDNTIRPDEEKTYYAAFHGHSQLQKGQDSPNVRIIFVFSNGQELTVLPSVISAGVGIHFSDKPNDNNQSNQVGKQ